MSEYYFHSRNKFGRKEEEKRKALRQSQIGGSTEVESEGSRAEGRTRGLQHVQRVSVGHAAPIISRYIFILFEEFKNFNVLGLMFVERRLGTKRTCCCDRDPGLCVPHLHGGSHTSGPGVLTPSSDLYGTS